MITHPTQSNSFPMNLVKSPVAHRLLLAASIHGAPAAPLPLDRHGRRIASVPAALEMPDDEHRTCQRATSPGRFHQLLQQRRPLLRHAR